MSHGIEITKSYEGISSLKPLCLADNPSLANGSRAFHNGKNGAWLQRRVVHVLKET